LVRASPDQAERLAADTTSLAFGLGQDAVCGGSQPPAVQRSAASLVAQLLHSTLLMCQPDDRPAALTANAMPADQLPDLLHGVAAVLLEAADAGG
jgi:hypothetical protein